MIFVTHSGLEVRRYAPVWYTGVFSIRRISIRRIPIIGLGLGLDSVRRIEIRRIEKEPVYRHFFNW